MADHAGVKKGYEGETAVADISAISTDGIGRVDDFYGRVDESTFRRVVRQMFSAKPFDTLMEEAGEKNQLKRSLGAIELVLLGIGAIIGTGIFVITGTAAAQNAGPAIVVSFVVAGIVSAFAGLCYAELAALVPVAGSGYTFTYSALGEFLAWLNGWSLVLEYMVGSATVSVGWAAYFGSLIYTITGYELSEKWTQAPVTFSKATQEFVLTGNYICLPAIGIAIFVCIILIIGTQQSSWLNVVIVTIKVTVIVTFIFAGATKVNTELWSPFFPPNEGDFGSYGVTGMMQAATKVFFAYIGFDSVSACAQEARNPKRDLPIGILGSLSVCTVLYIATSMVLTGMVSYTELNVADPIAQAAILVGMDWLATMVSVGAVAGLSSVMLVHMMAQPRILFAMAIDGFLPQFLTKVHPKFRTPWVATIITTICVCTMGGVLPIDVLGELTSLGTLFSFVLVGMSVLVLRKKEPNRERVFKVPGGPYVVPILSMLSSTMLIVTATTSSLIRMGIWLGIGVVLYFVYPLQHSKHWKVMNGRAPV